MRKFSPGLLINSSRTEGHSNLLIEAISINYPTFSLYDNFLDSSGGHLDDYLPNDKLLHCIENSIKDISPLKGPGATVNGLIHLKSYAAKFLSIIQ